MSKHKKYYNNSSKPTGYTPQNATPKKKQDKKDWTYWVVVIALAFTFIGSILGTVSFAKGCIEDYQQKNALSSIHSVEDIANYRAEKPFINSAFDTVTQNYIYNGNNFFVPSTPRDRNGDWVYSHSPYGLSVDVSISRQPINTIPIENLGNYTENTAPLISLSVYPTFRLTQLDLYSNIDMPFDYKDFNNFNYLWTQYARTSVSTDFYYVGIFGYYDYSTSGYANYYLTVNAYCDFDFNCDVQQIRFYHNTTLNNTTQTIIYVNTVEYIDSNGKECTLHFRSSYKNSGIYTGIVAWEDRTYFLTNSIDDNQYYKNGFQQGYQDGKTDGEKIGYDSGYKNGRSDGYNIGYNAGAESANEFTFLGLFGALFDAPITALQGLLNFNLLGFNMFNFFTALLTIGLIIFIVRLFV